jgi:ATP-dependent Clp protease adapter protein ClpS
MELLKNRNLPFEIICNPGYQDLKLDFTGYSEKSFLMLVFEIADTERTVSTAFHSPALPSMFLPLWRKVTCKTRIYEGGSHIQILARENPFFRNPQASPSRPTDRFYVVIIDNDTNTYEEVMEVCMKALSISELEAFQIALAVDHNGEAIVFEGTRSEAQMVADIISTIGIEVQLRPAV